MSGGFDLDISGLTRWWVLIFVSLSALTNSVICKAAQYKLTVGLQAPRNVSYPFSLLRLGSAMQIAIDKINANPSISGNVTFDFVYMDTDCNAKLSLQGFIKQVMNQNVSALFGPPCPEEAEVSVLFWLFFYYYYCCCVFNMGNNYGVGWIIETYYFWDPPPHRVSFL